MAMTQGEVAVAEAARQTAMLNGDVQALDALLAEDIVWIHASAKQDTKASFIEQFASGRLRCIRLDHAREVIRLFGTVALVTGLVDMEVVAGGERRVSANLYLAVWVKGPFGPLLVQWQSTRVQPN